MLPPSELKNKDFTRVVRGYSIPEVDEYVDFLMQKYAELYKTCDRIEKERAAARAELDAQRREIQTVRNTLLAARRASETVVEDARQKSREIMDETRRDCEAVIGQFDREIAREQKKLSEMKRCVLDFRAALFAQYADHIQFIENLTDAVPAELTALTEAKEGDCTGAIREKVRDMTEDKYVSETYDDIPQVLTEKVPKTVPVFSNPGAKKIVLPEEDTAPTTEMPSIAPIEDSTVGGAKITSIKSSVRALNAQYDGADVPVEEVVSPVAPTIPVAAVDADTDEDSPFGTEDAFLKFLEAHSNEDDDGDDGDGGIPGFNDVYGAGES